MTNAEAQLISAVIHQQDFKTPIALGITDDMFHAHDEEWAWIARYVRKYQKTPSRTAFKAVYPGFRLLRVDDMEFFCEEVKRSHIRYEMTVVLSNAADSLAAGDFERALSQLHKESIRLTAKLGSDQDTDILENWEDTFQEVLERKKRFDDTGLSGIPTGFATIDERTGGMGAGHLWVVAARLGEAKSWSLIRMATTDVIAGYRVQFNALEMTRSEVAFRVHAFLSSDVGQQVFSNLSLSRGEGFDLTQYKRFLRQLRKDMSKGGKLHIADASRGRISPLTIAAQIERNNPDIVFVDYITLMEMKGDRDWRSVAALSNELKSIGGQYQIPVVVAAQLNRNAVSTRGEPGGPEDLAQSDAIGQDADAIIIQRKTSARTIVGKLAKNRHGDSGTKYYLRFDPSRGVLREVSYSDYMDIKDEDMAAEKS